MGARKVALEDQIMIAVPRASLTVAAPPATITQRNCLSVFGLAVSDYLRLAGVAFPVKKEGRLRVARYADIESYLTDGAAYVEKQHADRRRALPESATIPVAAPFDAAAALRKAGFVPRRS